MSKRGPLRSVALSFGEGLKDDVFFDVTGLSKAELKLLVMDAVHKALRKNKKVKGITICT